MRISSYFQWCIFYFYAKSYFSFFNFTFFSALWSWCLHFLQQTKTWKHSPVLRFCTVTCTLVFWCLQTQRVMKLSWAPCRRQRWWIYWLICNMSRTKHFRVKYDRRMTTKCTSSFWFILIYFTTFAMEARRIARDANMEAALSWQPRTQAPAGTGGTRQLSILRQKRHF